jgi:hypothetical protein
MSGVSVEGQGALKDELRRLGICMIGVGGLAGRSSGGSLGLGVAFSLADEADGGGSVWWMRSVFLGSRRAFGVGVGEWVSSVA